MNDVMSRLEARPGLVRMVFVALMLIISASALLLQQGQAGAITPATFVSMNALI